MLKHIVHAMAQGMTGVTSRRDESMVRMVEIEYAKEFNHLAKTLGRRPSAKDISHLLA